MKKCRRSPPKDWTLWIGKQDKTVVKTLSHAQTYLLPNHIPIAEETTVTYAVVELDEQEPPETFTFVAPGGAKLVDTFPEPFRHGPDAAAVNLLGKPAPELTLKAADGNVVALSSFRDRPAFLEFWATWSGPCVELVLI